MALRSKKKRRRSAMGAEEETSTKQKKRSSTFGGARSLDQNIKESKKRRQEAKKSFVPNFFMKDGDVATIRILDEEPVAVYEHTFRLDGRWKTVTCLNQTDDEEEDICPVCDAGERRSLRAVYVIIDRRKWKDRKGKTHKNEVVLWKANTRTYKALKAIARTRGLTKQDLEVERAGAGTDTIYTVVPNDKKKLSLEDRNKKKIDIDIALAPLSWDKLAELVGGRGRDDDDDDDDDDYDDED